MIDESRRFLRGVLAGKCLVVVGYRLDTVDRLGAQLRELTDEPVLFLARGRGSGAPPKRTDLAVHVVDCAAATYSAETRIYEREVCQGAGVVAKALRAFDPTGDALVIGRLQSPVATVAARRFLGPATGRWARLEDKTVIDALWDEIGVARAPSAIVPVDDERALREATSSLAEPLGVVWSGDASRGPNSSADLVRWVRNPVDILPVQNQLSRSCRTVRVMPFLSGAPASVHGIVLDGRLAALRPIEIMTGHRHGSSELLYGGTASFWQPDASNVQEMRETARRVGCALAAEYGFRGVFGIDGVLAAGTFLPIELNPRWCGGFDRFSASSPELPLELLIAAGAAGYSLPFDAGVLAAHLIAAADTRPTGTIGVVSARPSTATTSHETRLGHLWIGPSLAGGTYARLELAAPAVAPGGRVDQVGFALLREALGELGYEDVDYRATSEYGTEGGPSPGGVVRP